MAMETPQRVFAPFLDDAAVLAVVDGFRGRTLPQEQWTHQAHLAVGLWHVDVHGEAESRDLLRDGITRYNLAVGTPNSDTRGYHETVTMFYVWCAARFAERTPPAPLVDRVNGFVADPLGSKSLAFRYWSRDVLLSVAARRTWVDPDLRPLTSD